MKDMSIKIFRKLFPQCLKDFVRSHYSLLEYDLKQYENLDPYKDKKENIFPTSKYKLCIVKEMFHMHKYYIAACEDLKVSYKVIDISETDWIDVVEKSGCDAFLIWPTGALTVWRRMFDDRTYLLEKVMKKIIYPTYSELWYYEFKQRLFDWMKANDIPHLKTWIFYKPNDAMDFMKNAPLPVVIKLNTGASASGVWIIRSRREGISFVKRVFKKGVKPRRWYPNDLQFYNILIQEYLPDFEEWRIARVGFSYVGYRKEKIGDFHSGSGAWSWLDPPKDMLDFVRTITDKFGITSMSFDIFKTSDGKYLVSEMQTVFGASKPAEYLKVNGKFGRYIYDYSEKRWIFEEGEFCKNHLCNLRVEYVVNYLLKKRNHEGE